MDNITNYKNNSYLFFTFFFPQLLTHHLLQMIEINPKKKNLSKLFLTLEQKVEVMITYNLNRSAIIMS
jgi:hypothetical protein